MNEFDVARGILDAFGVLCAVIWVFGLIHRWIERRQEKATRKVDREAWEKAWLRAEAEEAQWEAEHPEVIAHERAAAQEREQAREMQERAEVRAAWADPAEQRREAE
jgi:hypothetical protein